MKIFPFSIFVLPVIYKKKHVQYIYIHTIYNFIHPSCATYFLINYVLVLLILVHKTTPFPVPHTMRRILPPTPSRPRHSVDDWPLSHIRIKNEPGRRGGGAANTSQLDVYDSVIVEQRNSELGTELHKMRTLAAIIVLMIMAHCLNQEEQPPNWEAGEKR